MQVHLVDLVGLRFQEGNPVLQVLEHGLTAPVGRVDQKLPELDGVDLVPVLEYNQFGALASRQEV